MIKQQSVKLRPKFLASIFLLLGGLLLLGQFYTIGLWLPLFLFSAYLFFTTSKDVVGIAPYKYFQIAFFLALFIGLFIHLAFSINYSLSWFITAALLSFSFKIVRVAGIAIGVILPFINT